MVSVLMHEEQGDNRSEECDLGLRNSAFSAYEHYVYGIKLSYYITILEAHNFFKYSFYTYSLHFRYLCEKRPPEDKKLHDLQMNAAEPAYEETGNV